MKTKIKSKFHFKIHFLLLLVTLVATPLATLSVSHPAFAFFDFGKEKKVEIPSLETFAPLFVPLPPLYTPLDVKTLEDEKLNALQQKDAQKMFAIGMMYFEGNIITADAKQAHIWLENAAKNGNENALFPLAYLYKKNAEAVGVRNIDKILASKYYRPIRAEFEEYFKSSKVDKSLVAKVLYLISYSQDSNIIYRLADIYMLGDIVKKSNKKAFELHSLAYKLDPNNINALAKIYLSYQFGIGTNQNIKTAIKKLTILNQKTTVPSVKDFSTKLLGRIYLEFAISQTDKNLKFKLYNLSWSYGNQFALDALADCYFRGYGVEKDYLKSEEYYKLSISKFKSIYAMERLGMMYLLAPGDIERNYKQAYDYFLASSQKGGVNGAYLLGHMYHYGIGVPQDLEQAKVWFKRSENLSKATNRRNLIYENPNQQSIDFDQLPTTP